MKNSHWIALLCVAFATMFLNACGDSVDADEQSVVDDTSLSKEMASSSSSKAKSSSSSAKATSSSSAKSSSSEALYPESFKPDDAEYPYAGIPRIVIETEYRQAIKDRETEIPAKLQIWGEKEAESEMMDLTIRGRGNSSWKMPKKSYKIEFEKKQSMLGMPKDKDWALIANYVDRSLIRNYIAYQFANAMGVYYAPHCDFVELYLNGEYWGVYLLTETIKIGKNRVNIPENEESYIVEVDGKYREGEQVIFSDVLLDNGTGVSFRVHNPKNATDSVLDTVKAHIESFEKFLKTIEKGKKNKIEEWIDIDESIKHYWVQELFKNPDACFYTSVYFSWVKGEYIKMGPVWDYDMAMGGHYLENVINEKNWYIRSYWYEYLFNDETYGERVGEEWKLNHLLIDSMNDSIDVVSAKLEKAARNNFKRWNILGLSEQWFHSSYKSYSEAVEDLKNWIQKRIEWIDSNMQ